MPQIVLDPGNLAAVNRKTPDARVPEKVRRFGFVPDDASLLPGDVVLFEAVRLKRGSRLIQRAQRATYTDEHARWHHVAVHIADGNILEALPGGVVYRPLYHYSGTHVMRFRRDPNLSDAERYRIAIQSMARLRERYSLWALPRVWWNMTRAISNPMYAIRGTRAVICSQLYCDAYTMATARSATPGVLQDVPPAELSLSRALIDVSVDWVGLR